MPKYERSEIMSSSVGSKALASACQPKSPRRGRPRPSVDLVRLLKHALLESGVDESWNLGI
jgi:hypothetical protein